VDTDPVRSFFHAIGGKIIHPHEAGSLLRGLDPGAAAGSDETRNAPARGLPLEHRPRMARRSSKGPPSR
jgi:hypothetical protein